MMDWFQRSVAALAFAASAGVCLTTGAQAETWDELVAAAKAEGELVIAVHHGEANRLGRTKGWEEDFPDIKLNIINVSNQEVIPRLIREYSAGIHTVDVIFGGCRNYYGDFQKNDMLLPFRDAIVDESLLKDETWRNGFESGFCDADGKWAYAYERSASARGYINWDYVDRDALTGLDDLLKPEFDGKIVWHDPRDYGTGAAIAIAIAYSKDEAFMKKLFAKDAVYTPNRRLAAEWVVRGRHPIALGVAEDYMKIFQDQGLCKNCEQIPGEWFSVNIAHSGSANIGYLKDTPHPAATKLYINWFLQQEQQQTWSDETGGASRRVDVEPGSPGVLPEEGVEFIDIFEEKNFPFANSIVKLAREVVTAAAVEN